MNAYVQQNQPSGVPPLELTGERTLPDVRRKIIGSAGMAVYEWIGAQVAGLEVLDMACGGATARAGSRARRQGSRRGRQPGGPTARPAALCAPDLSFERGWSRPTR